MSQNTMQQKKEWAVDTCNKVDGSQDNHAGGIWAHLKKGEQKEPFWWWKSCTQSL